MDTLAFDGRMGASGDMILAALLAAGADPAVLNRVEDRLDLRYVLGKTTKNGVSARTVDVVLDDGSGGDRDGTDRHRRDTDAHDRGHELGDHDHHGEHGGDHDHEHGGNHDHHDHHGDHGHEHGEDHGHEGAHGGHGGTPAEGHGPHRSYREVCDLVESIGLPAGVEADALAVFEILAAAEASVHGTDVDSIHFHEVGADDAVADVVGACLLVDDLGPERVVTTPLAAGGGEMTMHHGTYPVPAPAVVEIAGRADWSLKGGPVDAELLTPTGAAILAHFADGVDALPLLRVRGSGYGAGGYDFPERPNVLRALVGDGGSLVRDEITVLETNLDDASPELLGALHETLADAGARDVAVLPATMKKSRPGHLVKVVAKPEDAKRVARRLAEETGTLGVREHGTGHRWIAEREVETVTVEVGGEPYEVDVKVASDTADDVYDVSAEFDDALAVARETGLPVREVMRRAEAAIRRIDGE